MEQVLGMAGRVSGLAPVWVDPQQGVFNGALITLGARGDSYYEYLLKQWILSGKTQDVFLRCILVPLPRSLLLHFRLSAYLSR